MPLDLPRQACWPSTGLHRTRGSGCAGPGLAVGAPMLVGRIETDPQWVDLEGAAQETLGGLRGLQTWQWAARAG